MKFYSIQEVTKILNVTAQTLRNWDKTGKLIPNHKTVSGYRYYTEEQIENLLGKNDKHI